MKSRLRRAILKGSGILVGSLFVPFCRVFALGERGISSPRIALLIGNGDYSYAPLKNPVNDARDLNFELKMLGFETQLLLNAKLEDISTAVLQYADKLAKKKAVGLFYYAGHGCQLSWRNYLVPVDAEIDRVDDIPKQSYELNLMLSSLTKAKNPMNIIILDACRDNPFGKKLPVEQKGLSQFDAPVGSLLSYATSPGNVASDGSGKNGLFTENLLREIRDPVARIEDVFKRVRLGVRLASKGTQVPWESSSLEDDFYFNATGIDPGSIEAGLAKSTNTLAVSKDTALPVAKQNTPTNPIISLMPQNSLTDEEKNRLFKEELALWEKAQTSPLPAPTEEYLRKYPSGNYSELALARLDRLLAQKGEKTIEIVSSVGNPFSKGVSSGIGKYSIGDQYSYQGVDAFTDIVNNAYIDTVTKIAEDKIEFNGGVRVIDALGNDLISPDAQFITPAQFFPETYAINTKWTTRFTRYRVPATLGPGEYEMNFEVADRVQLTTPAGNFNAFYIKGEGRNNFGGKLLRDYWIDPDKCYRPLMVEIKGYGNRGRVTAWEKITLIAFQQKIRSVNTATSNQTH